MKRLILIDGNAILHRAYHALPPLTNRSGELVNAVYGFSTMLLKVIADLNPAYLAVTFDMAAPTLRQMEYLGYQAHRPVMDEDLSTQIAKVHEVLATFDIPILAVAGYEADDLIGTLSRQATESKKVDEVVIVTGDRDIMQLVNEKVKVYLPVKGMSEAVMVGPQEVKERLGVSPERIVDYKGLAGDPSDNYPGVPGIGPKTAVELLGQYETIDNLYQHLGELPESLARKLTEGRELGQISQKLARIMTDAPVVFQPESCRFKFEDDEKEKMADKFLELGFRSLASRLRPTANKPAKEKKSKKKDLQTELF